MSSPYEMEQPRTKDDVDAAARALGCRMQDLTVLAKGNEPFDRGTDTEVRDAEWFAQLWQRFRFGAGVHVRRVHYRAAIEAAGEVFLPSGEMYENTDEHYYRLSGASICARDLGVVDASLFEDRRNDPTRRYAPQRTWPLAEPACDIVLDDERPWRLPQPDRWWAPSFGAEDLLPLELGDPRIDADVGTVHVDGYDYDPAEQPYYEVLWIEKSTMNDVLDPLCRRLGVDFMYAKGFNSKTRPVEWLLRAKQLGKPLRVFTISDYDPAGSHMPVGTARQLEFYRDIYAPDTQVVVRHLGMHRDWVDRYDLPRKPIKDNDRRKGNFEAIHGEGGVELDALEALRPGELAREIRAAISEYRDTGREGRLDAAEDDAKRAASEQWRAITASVRTEVETVGADVDAIVDRFRDRLAAVQARRDEVMAPFIDRLQQLEDEAVAALEPVRVEHAELVDDLHDELGDADDSLAALWGQVQDLAGDADIDLPERPAPEVDPDEEGALFDTRRHWWDQLQHYHAVQGRRTERPPKPCEHCGAEFTPKRSDGIYCSRPCRTNGVRAKNRQAAHPKPCEECGSAFQPLRSDSRFCTQSCAKKDYHRRKREVTS